MFCKNIIKIVLISALIVPVLSCRDMGEGDDQERGEILFSLQQGGLPYFASIETDFPENSPTIIAAAGTSEIIVGTSRSYFSPLSNYAVFFEYGGDIILFNFKDYSTASLGVSGVENGAVSPDGTMIAYGATDVDTASYYIYYLDFGPPGEFVNLPLGGGLFGVSWAPDSEQAVFCSGADPFIYQLHVYDKYPVNYRQITFFGDRTAVFPDWSPLGSSIVFQSDFENISGEYDIWKINPDGSGLENLTLTADVSEWVPVYSPNGKKILYVGQRISDNLRALFVMNSDGTGKTQLTDFSADIEMQKPTWSTYGSKIVFFASWTGFNEIYSINPDGSRLKRMTFTDTDARNGVWISR